MIIQALADMIHKGKSAVSKYENGQIIIINLMASFLDSNEKWGLFTGISSRPLMPVALKALFTKIPLKETRELLQRLTISKDDIRLIKIYNMLTVTGHGDF